MRSQDRGSGIVAGAADGRRGRQVADKRLQTSSSPSSRQDRDRLRRARGAILPRLHHPSHMAPSPCSHKPTRWQMEKQTHAGDLEVHRRGREEERQQ